MIKTKVAFLEGRFLSN